MEDRSKARQGGLLTISEPKRQKAHEPKAKKEVPDWPEPHCGSLSHNYNLAVQLVTPRRKRAGVHLHGGDKGKAQCRAVEGDNCHLTT